MDIKLTEREFELFLLINQIWEFAGENPDKFPEEEDVEKYIGEIMEQVIVSNKMKVLSKSKTYESEEYRECLQELEHLNLVDKKTKITKSGKKLLIRFYDMIQTGCEALGKENILSDKHQIELAIAKKEKKDRAETFEQIMGALGAFAKPFIKELVSDPKTSV